ncbi:MAG: T9SS type A sorting domain-containing protein [Ferruginibacter sp.]
MAMFRCIFIATFIWFMLSAEAKAQTIYYPTGSSRLLKETARDIAYLFQKAIPASRFDTMHYNSLPSAGIVLVYDSTIQDNQLCKLITEPGLLIFKAAQDNGLIFGLYQYLNDLGFSFYQPGEIWQVIPKLNSAFINVNKDYNCSYKYKTWFISGGHNRWAMDDNSNYNWDIYFGENGHNWALYQRRNGMLGNQRFTGHRGDIMTSSFINSLQTNSCNIACYNGSRIANSQSVPDVNSNTAMSLWASAIEQKYTQYKNIVFGNKLLYADLYRNFNYYNGNIGIEVPDGAQWANSKDNLACNAQVLKSPADQHAILSGYTHDKLNQVYSNVHTQVYAYSSHANTPSANLAINKNTDVQVVPTAFQSESSPVGLLNRWYKTHPNISEYHYLNITQWGGETPMFWYSDLQQTLKRLKQQQSQGIVWEASPAKFASLPFLKAANDNLLYDKNTDSSISAFCNDMFGAASGSINSLLKQWSNETTVTNGGFMADNKYKIPLYLQMLNEAVQQASGEPDLVQLRLKELKCYVHYMILYYDWFFDQGTNEAKADKAAALCIFLARINKLQLVNSYFLIYNIANRYGTSSSFYTQYNPINGTAYMQGNLPLINMQEVDVQFEDDLNKYGKTIADYQLLNADKVAEKLSVGNIVPLSKLQVKISFTNGAEYPGRNEFFIKANGPGTFVVNYIPSFSLPEKGTINFSVESTEKAMEIIYDQTISNGAASGSFTIQLPQAGTYKLSVVSKWQSSVSMDILTYKNLFYKNTAFLGSKTENYRDAIGSLPGYFFVPAGMHKIFFSIHNAYANGGYANAETIGKTFSFKDNNGYDVMPKAVEGDPALFYLEIPAGKSGTFWQASNMVQYDLCFANISNLLWFAERKVCKIVPFTVSIKKIGDNCITHVAATVSASTYQWEVNDNGRMFYYSIKAFDLPDYISPNAMITLVADNQCSSTRILKEEENYFKKKEACASGAMMPGNNTHPVLYPNPSNGLFFINDESGAATMATSICVFDALGRQVVNQQVGTQINLKHAGAGVFVYHITVGEKTFSGKLVKL